MWIKEILWKTTTAGGGLCHFSTYVYISTRKASAYIIFVLLLKKNFLLKLDNDKHVHHYLEMSYGGGALWDNWALSDVGVTSGKAIRCLIKVKKYMFLSIQVICSRRPDLDLT